MRKILLILVLALSIFLCYTTVVNGLEVGDTFKVSNYKEVEAASKDIDTLISQLVNVNDMEYKSKQSNLQTAIKSYQDAKEEYETMAEMMKAAASEEEQNSDISMVDIYDVDFLWTVIGNYGTEEGIALKFDVAKSATSSLDSSEYTMCDLKFTVSGDYIPITEFIYHIEEDSKLGFEISDFKMAKGGQNLQATFTIKNVPINNKNLTELQTSVDSISSSDTNTTDSNTSISDATQNALEQTGSSLGGGHKLDSSNTTN